MYCIKKLASDQQLRKIGKQKCIALKISTSTACIMLYSVRVIEMYTFYRRHVTISIQILLSFGPGTPDKAGKENKPVKVGTSLCECSIAVLYSHITPVCVYCCVI